MRQLVYLKFLCFNPRLISKHQLEPPTWFPFDSAEHLQLGHTNSENILSKNDLNLGKHLPKLRSKHLVYNMEKRRDT